jgi:hypothetical protein
MTTTKYTGKIYDKYWSSSPPQNPLPVLKDKQRIKNIDKCGRIPTHTKEFGRKECLGDPGLFNILPSQGKMKTTQGIRRGRRWVRPAKETKKGKRYRYKCCRSGDQDQERRFYWMDTIYSDWEGHILLG